jgi:hypothetical protein
MLLYGSNLSYAQTHHFCQKLFIRDFTDKNGKKWEDPSLRDDVESIFNATNAAKLLLYKEHPNIVVLFKNERHLKEVSNQMVEQLLQKGVAYLLSGVCEQGQNDIVSLQLNIRGLQNNATEYAGTLQMPQSVFSNRTERNLKLKQFIEYNVLKLSPPLSKTPLYLLGTGVGLGLGALTVGTLSSINRRNDWQTYYAASPTDPQGKFIQERQKFRTTTAIAVAGGIVATTCGVLLLREWSRHRKPHAVSLVPKMGTDGLGIAVQF